ncbi:hypothetical protein Cgig2_000596 [Carnegiea gigantea]|uniref:Uncharacterized protein n=1 Tax=Carnegiea gigantea TaxID=171969 RepID=A0A9Q1GMV7_9CARY|nr:hypothetical protein Cgig2_000596 [Carnegiea gigantea]
MVMFYLCYAPFVAKHGFYVEDLIVRRHTGRKVIVGMLVEKGEKLRRPTGGRKERGRVSAEVACVDVEREVLLMEQRTCSKRRQYIVDEGKDVDTSSGSDYMGEGSTGGGSSGDSVSLESELEFAEDMGGGSETEGDGTSIRHGKRVSNIPKLEVLWKYFEEANLMDSFGSDFKGGVDGGGDDSPNVSLVSKMDLDSVSDVEAYKGSMSKKVVSGQLKRGRRKATGDGVVFGDHPLKGEKCGGVTIREKCTIERVVSLNEAMSDVQKEAVMGTVLRPILKYRSFAMEHNLALTLVKCWVPRSKAFRLVDRLVPISVFDVALLAGLPVTGERLNFDDDKVMTEFRDIVKQRVHEEEQEELRRRKVYLYEKNAQEEQLELWLKLYTWLVLSGLLLPRAMYGAA